jgi:hypothetical protein
MNHRQIWVVVNISFSVEVWLWTIVVDDVAEIEVVACASFVQDDDDDDGGGGVVVVMMTVVAVVVEMSW